MKKVIYIPEGVPNIKDIFDNVDFNNVENYTISALGVNDVVLATTRVNFISKCCEGKIRVHFINSLGELDNINLKLIDKALEVKSENWTKSLPLTFNRNASGITRSNVNSNENFEAETNAYSEKEQYWLKDLFRSGLAWIEMDLPNGFEESIKKEYVPIYISDGKLIERKSVKRYDYSVRISFKMSNANINLR